MEISFISSEEHLDRLIKRLEEDSFFTSDYSFLKQDGLHVYGWFELQGEMNGIYGSYFIVGKTFFSDQSTNDTGIFASLRKYGSSKKYKGIMDAKGEYVVPTLFTDIFHIGEGLLKLERNGKYGVARVDKGIICPIEYDEIGIVKEFVFSVEKDGKLGFMDTFGNIVIPFEYESQERYTSTFNEGKAYVKKYFSENSIYGFYIDHYNNIVSEKNEQIDDRKSQIKSYDDYTVSSIDDSDILDAYEGDESNMWNTD